MRIAKWLTLYVFLLGVADIDVLYEDGLHIHLNSWTGALARKLRDINERRRRS